MQNGYIATLIANKVDGDQQFPWSWGKRKLQSFLPGLDTKVRSLLLPFDVMNICLELSPQSFLPGR